ncbi:MAG: hypothetical protein ACYSOV_06200 [Planctomycetota bacterium]
MVIKKNVRIRLCRSNIGDGVKNDRINVWECVLQKRAFADLPSARNNDYREVLGEFFYLVCNKFDVYT